MADPVALRNSLDSLAYQNKNVTCDVPGATGGPDRQVDSRPGHRPGRQQDCRPCHAPNIGSREQCRAQARKENKAARDKAKANQSALPPRLTAATRRREKALAAQRAEHAAALSRTGMLEHLGNWLAHWLTPPGAMALEMDAAWGQCEAGQPCAENNDAGGAPASTPIGQLQRDLGPRFLVRFNQPADRLPANSLNDLDIIISYEESFGQDDLDALRTTLEQHVKKGDQLITESAGDWPDRPRGGLFKPINGVKWTQLESGQDMSAFSAARQAVLDMIDKYLAFFKRNPPKLPLASAREWRAMTFDQKNRALSQAILQLRFYEAERYGAMPELAELNAEYNRKLGEYKQSRNSARRARVLNVIAEHERGNRRPRARFLVLTMEMARDCGQNLYTRKDEMLGLVTRADLPLPVSHDWNPAGRLPIDYLVKRYANTFTFTLSPSLQRRKDRSLKGVLLVFGDIHGVFRIRTERKALMSEFERPGDKSFTEISQDIYSETDCESVLNPCIPIDHPESRAGHKVLYDAKMAVLDEFIAWSLRYGFPSAVFDNPEFKTSVAHDAKVVIKLNNYDEEGDALVRKLEALQTEIDDFHNKTMQVRNEHMITLMKPQIDPGRMNFLFVGNDHLKMMGPRLLEEFETILVMPSEEPKSIYSVSMA